MNQESCRTLHVSYEGQESLLKDLNQCVGYRKTIEFFIKSKGLHSYFERNGSELATAISNAIIPWTKNAFGRVEGIGSSVDYGNNE